MRTSGILLSILALLVGCGSSTSIPWYANSTVLGSEPSQVFWGDTHLHTSYSPDAFFFGNTCLLYTSDAADDLYTV
mgnify:CR=1 FL=1